MAAHVVPASAALDHRHIRCELHGYSSGSQMGLELSVGCVPHMGALRSRAGVSRLCKSPRSSWHAQQHRLGGSVVRSADCHWCGALGECLSKRRLVWLGPRYRVDGHARGGMVGALPRVPVLRCASHRIALGWHSWLEVRSATPGNASATTGFPTNPIPAPRRGEGELSRPLRRQSNSCWYRSFEALSRCWQYSSGAGRRLFGSLSSTPRFGSGSQPQEGSSVS